MTGTPYAALLARCAEDPGRPLLTYYGPGGERVELSRATTLNWVAKTANFFRDVVGAPPSARAALLLPAHWRTAVVLLGAWAARLRTTFAAPAPGELVVVAEEDLERVPADAGDVVAMALEGLTGTLSVPVPGLIDYGEEVRGCADTFPDQTRPDAVVHETAAQQWSGAQLLAAGAGSAGQRLLTSAGFDTDAGLSALAGALGGGGLVLCAGLSGEELSRVAAAERVDAVAG